MAASLETLKEPLQSRFKKLIELIKTDKTLNSLGIVGLIATETRRDKVKQACEYLRGRMKRWQDVNLIFNLLVGYTMAQGPCENEATWTLESKHIIDCAVDAFPSADGKTIIRNPKQEIWDRIGYLARSLGIKWGGDWPVDKREPWHFEQ